MELNQNEVSVPQPILKIGLRGYLEDKFFYFASTEVHHLSGREISFF